MIEAARRMEKVPAIKFQIASFVIQRRYEIEQSEGSVFSRQVADPSICSG